MPALPYCFAAGRCRVGAVVASSCAWLPLPAFGNEPAGSETQILLWVIVVLQTLILIGIQLSRIRFKRKGEDLKQAQRDLEQRVIERTNKLRAINNQLYDEIAKHEITEALLRETQDYLNSMINSMPSVLIGITREGVITHWNTAATHVTGIPAREALGRRLREVYPQLPMTEGMIHETIDKGVPQIKENIQREHEDQTQYSELTIYPLLSAEISGAVIRLDDVTMRVRLEAMMIQNEKMMSLGELAAGMAHEINNPLSAILHGIQNIYRRTSPGLPRNHRIAEDLGITVDQVYGYLDARGIFKFLDAIREAGDRSARIVTNMLEFSRSNTRNHQLTNLAELVEHSLDLAKNSFVLKTPEGTEQLKIIREFDADVPQISCSPIEIQQVVLNLLRNACQAFYEASYVNEQGNQPPQIVLRIRNGKDCVSLEVEDNGPGMKETVSRHVFEPFFTTKEVGKGTGLGLSVTYFIVTEHHNGTIEVESTPGKGTNFIITLPVSQG